VAFSFTTLPAAPWIAAPEIIVSDTGAASGSVSGVVFHDLNGDGSRQPDEPGVPAVRVSNGTEVVATDAGGRYVLPVYADMNLMVIQPSGWQVPVDRRMVPQFFYVHKENGSPAPLRFGGLPATGPMPEVVNFPLRKTDGTASFRAAVIGDSQTYSNTELGYLRDSMVVDLLTHAGDSVDLMLYLGDVVGDDLGLLDRLLEIGATVGSPQWLVHGNHDLDFDATSDADSSDSWRRIYGPQYYAFEVGQSLFVVLDNVVYPCGPADAAAGGRDFCLEGQPTYNGRITDQQITWLTNLLALTPPDRMVVLSHHIPLVSFADPSNTQHQTDNATELYALLAAREALSLSGHTHTIENHAPGQSFDGWETAVGVSALPFRHIVAGAASGSWYQGDFNIRGVPMSLQRFGAPKGVLLMDFDGHHYSERYLADGLHPDTAMWLGINSPAFRHWYNALVEFATIPARERATLLPPYSINDLPDTKMLTPADLAEGTWLTANVWAGCADTAVKLRINGGPAIPMQRTQQGTGEAVKIGAEWADPFATQRQLSVARFAYASESGIERNQGVEAFKGRRFGPAAPQPMSRLADRNMHLWRVQLPEDLPLGVHRAMVTATDRNGQSFTSFLVFELRDQLPPPRWRSELW
jgi:hypothetical protein